MEIRRHPANSYRSLEPKLKADCHVLSTLQRERLSERHRRALSRSLGAALITLAYHNYNNRRPLASAMASARALTCRGSRMAAVRRLALLPAMPLVASRKKVSWDNTPKPT